MLEPFHGSPHDRYAECHGEHGRLGPRIMPRGHHAGQGARDPFGGALPPACEHHVVFDPELPGTEAQFGLERTAAHHVERRALAQQRKRLEQQIRALLVVQSARVHQPSRRGAGRLHEVDRIDRRATLAKHRLVCPERQELFAGGRSMHEQEIKGVERGAKLADRHLARPLVSVVFAAHYRHRGRRRTSRGPPRPELVRVNQVGAG